MIFQETKLEGVFTIEIEQIKDERGFFARSFCSREFEKRGLNPHLVQCNISYNKRKGILRGMHYQVSPYAEAKLVRCTLGAIYDVVVDLRSDSLTFKQWFATELTSINRKMLYVPEGFAHGFQVLEDETEVFYQMSEFYNPQASQGFRWNDPAFKIEWPLPDACLSEKDRNYPDFTLRL